MPKGNERDEILFMLNRKWQRVDIDNLSVKKLSQVKVAMILSHFNYSRDLAIEYISSRDKKKIRANIASTFSRYLSKWEKMDIDMKEFVREKVETNGRAAKGDRSVRGIAKNSVKKLSAVLDVFNIGKESLIEEISKIGDSPLSHDSILKSYKELYILLMAKAKGEIATKQTSISYELIDDDKSPTGYRKQIAKNGSNQKRLYETTQSHLPDERAFAGALVVMEVINRMENGNQSVLTNDETEQMYDEIMQRAELDREKYKRRALDAEIVDD